jgi:hypothetical protein
MVLASLTAALALAAPAQVVVPVIDPLTQPCYVSAGETQRESVTIVGHDFLPNVTLKVFVDDVEQITPSPPMTDDAGGIKGIVPAPYVDSGERPFTIRLTDPDPNHGNSTATVQGRVSALSVDQVPIRPRSTSSKVRFGVRGFTTPGIVYAHYVHAGRSRKTVRIGKPTGPCGTVARRLRQFPFRHPPQVGTWIIAFDQQERYSPQSPRRTNLSVRVLRRLKPR